MGLFTFLILKRVLQLTDLDEQGDILESWVEQLINKHIQIRQLEYAQDHLSGWTVT